MRFFLDFPCNPPEWDVDRRDYMLAEPLRVSSDGHIVLSDSPGMEFDLATDRFGRHASPELARLPTEA